MKEYLLAYMTYRACGALGNSDVQLFQCDDGIRCIRVYGKNKRQVINDFEAQHEDDAYYVKVISISCLDD